jgi:hypothetical protein
MSRELFIYYRVSTGNADVLEAQVRNFQATLCNRHAGLQARLLRRPIVADTPQTWMEMYARPSVADGVSKSIEDDIERTASTLAALVEGPRHREVFEAMG